MCVKGGEQRAGRERRGNAEMVGRSTLCLMRIGTPVPWKSGDGTQDLGSGIRGDRSCHVL